VLCAIDASAFVAILLALLFTFMADGLPHVHQGISVDLAWTDHSKAMPGAMREDAVIVAVQRDGKIFLDTTQIKAPEDLATKISERVRLGGERKVYIKADARAHYRAVAEVVDALHNAQVERIGLLTEQRKM
jgi:biopolymer transport protein ExbD